MVSQPLHRLPPGPDLDIGLWGLPALPLQLQSRGTRAQSPLSFELWRWKVSGGWMVGSPATGCLLLVFPPPGNLEEQLRTLPLCSPRLLHCLLRWQLAGLVLGSRQGLGRREAETASPDRDEVCRGGGRSGLPPPGPGPLTRLSASSTLSSLLGILPWSPEARWCLGPMGTCQGEGR